MTQTEFQEKDEALRLAFRQAVINNRPDEAKELIKQHRELCKANR